MIGVQAPNREIIAGHKSILSQKSKKQEKPEYKVIPVQLSEQEFEKFILPHLSLPKRGLKCKIGYHKVFNYILKILYTGMQWKELPIKAGPDGKDDARYAARFTIEWVFAWEGKFKRLFLRFERKQKRHLELKINGLHIDQSQGVL